MQEDIILEQEGKWCQRDGCKGIMEFKRETGESCSCHLGHPPCSACVNMKLTCTKCGHVLETIEDVNSERDINKAISHIDLI